jgi:hypothetical protein
MEHLSMNEQQNQYFFDQVRFQVLS